MRKSPTVTVLGLGYMGLPWACLISSAGYEVKGFDISQEKVDRIIAMDVFLDNEPGLRQVVSQAFESKRFSVSTELHPSDIFIVSVPTPTVNDKCDLSYVEKAILYINKVLKDGDLVIIESTVRPKACVDVLMPLLETTRKKYSLAYCPERAIPGNTIHELIYNDRIIGGIDEDSTNKALNLYRNVAKGEVHCTNATTAECVKLMENSFRDVNIALANNFSEICGAYGVDAFDAIKLANKHPRVSILQPGPGVGGHCIAVDPWFLVDGLEDGGELIIAARQVNDSRPVKVANFVKELALKRHFKKVGLLGISYKKNVDDTRESPALKILNLLKKEGFFVCAHDPFVENWPCEIIDEYHRFEDQVDMMILITEHDIFKGYTFSKLVLDTRGNLEHSQFREKSDLVRFY